MIVTSIHNPRVKQIRALASRKERERTGLFFVEGLHLVLEARQTGAAIELLVVAPLLLHSPLAQDLVQSERTAGRPILTVTPDVFRELVPRDLVQGVGAIVQQRWSSLPELPRSQRVAMVALAETQYPGNLGTILRTVDAVGADGIVLLDATSDPYDPIAVRASVGAVFSVPLARSSFGALVNWAQAGNLPIIGTAPACHLDYRSVHYQTPLVLLMGSEGRGLAPDHIAACDRIVSIPMVGRCDSLNLAVATSLILYEAIGRRHLAVGSIEEGHEG